MKAVISATEIKFSYTDSKSATCDYTISEWEKANVANSEFKGHFIITVSGGSPAGTDANSSPDTMKTATKLMLAYATDTVILIWNVTGGSTVYVFNEGRGFWLKNN